MKILNNFQKEINKSEGFQLDSSIVEDDAVLVTILTNNTTYKFHGGEHLNDCFGQLINELIKISPITFEIPDNA